MLLRTAVTLLIAHAALAAVLTEKRAVTDSNGKKFQCTYKLNYNAKTVSKTKSKVTCTPKATGKTVVESFYVESLGKMATVTHTIKKGKGTISKISLADYTPTTTAAPGGSDFAATHNCSCRLAPPKALQTMMQNLQTADFSQYEMPAMGRSLVRLAARPANRGGSGNSLFSTLITNLLNALFGNLLGRSLQPLKPHLSARLASKPEARQLLPGLLGGGNPGGLLGGGLLGGLGGAPAPAPATGGGIDTAALMAAIISGDSNAINQLMMQMVQQQVQSALSNPETMNSIIGEMENMMNDPATEAMVDQALESMLQQVMTEMGKEDGPVGQMMQNMGSMGEAEMQQFMQEMMGGMGGMDGMNIDMTGMSMEEMFPVMHAMMGGKTPEEFLQEMGMEPGKGPSMQMQCGCVEL